MTDVALVQMPFAPVEHPSIALGVLASALEEGGIGCTALYANLEFCGEIGLDSYCGLSSSPGPSLLAEWTFSAAAFPELEADPERFFELPTSDLSPTRKRLLAGRFPRLEPVERLEEIRHRAEAFVDRVARRLLALEPRIVGCTSTFQQHCAALALLRRVRELAPGVPTMIGGANCESAMGLATLRCFPWVDVVVSGEADLLIVDLCRELLARGRRLDGAELPHGALARAEMEAGRWRVDGAGDAVPRAVVTEMDRVATPDYRPYFQALEETGLDAFITPGLLIETSRGCWWGAKSHCTFCGLNGGGMTYRSKSPERVLRELRELREAYGIERFEAVDNILDMGFLRTVLPELAAADGGYSIFFETKANLRREQMELLADAGVSWIQPGIESLHPEALDLLRKGNTPVINLQCLKWALEFGVRVEWLLLHDIPGDRDAWYRELADLLPALFHLEPPSGATAIEFHRFSPYQTNPAEFGLELAPQPAYREVFPVDAADAADLAYYFVDTTTTTTTTSSSSSPRPGLGRCLERIAEWRASWARARKRGAEPPRLLRRDADGRPAVADTRPCAAAPLHRLDPVEDAVLWAADQGIGREALARRLASTGGGPAPGSAALEAAVARLLRDRLVVDLGGTLLSLPVRAAAEPLADVSPAGHVRLERYLDRWLRRQLGDVPVPPGLAARLVRARSRPAVAPPPPEG